MIAFYSPSYFMPLPEGHPFPMEKFPQAAELVRRECGGLRVEEPLPVSEADLARVHTMEYLEKIRTGRLAPAERLKLGLPWKAELFARSALEAGGTMAAMWAAWREGLAFNLAGGTHHAGAATGAGFCVFNDVAVAIRAAQARLGEVRVAVVDTDAHQGDGTHAIFAGETGVRTYSIHVGKNYPSRKVPGTMDVELPRWVTGPEYLAVLTATLPRFLAAGADMIFWVTGADLHADDRFGQMRLAYADLEERDRRVSRLLLACAVPLVVVYGGGYHRVPGMTARIHANTVKEVLKEAGAGGTARDWVQRRLSSPASPG